MNILGSIGLVAAFKRYKDAKKAYEEARVKSIAEQDALLVAIDEYEWNYKKDGSALSYYDREPDLKTLLEDLKIIPKLYFGYGSYLGTSFYNVKLEFDFFNTSDKTITIMRQADNLHDFVASLSICGNDDALGTGDLSYNIVIPPHTGLVVTAPLGAFIEEEKSSLIEDKFINLIKRSARKYTNGAIPKTDELNDLYEAFQEASKISGSTKNIVLTNALFADIAFYYYDNENKSIRRALYYKVPGICEWAGHNPGFKDEDLIWRTASEFAIKNTNG